MSRAAPRLRIYTDASWTAHRAGIAIVCVSFDLWWVEARAVRAHDSEDAEAQAIEWACRWTRGLPAIVHTDCLALTTKALASSAAQEGIDVRWCRRRSHPANIVADAWAGRARATGAGFELRVDPATRYPVGPVRVVSWRTILDAVLATWTG